MEDKEKALQDENCETTLQENASEEQTITEETAKESANETAKEAEKETASEAEKEAVKEEKPKKSFDEKVDGVANFIKKYKIALLCGGVAIIALICGILIGGIGKEKGDVDVENPTVATATPKPAEIAPTQTSTPTSQPSAEPTENPSEEEPTATTQPETPQEATSSPIYYADLLESVAYFEDSEDLELATADVISILNAVLEGDNAVVKAGESEGVSKLAETVSVEVTKQEMLALLQDTSAKFVGITQSVSGDTLTLDVDMNIQIPEEVMEEVKSANFVIAMALSMFSTDLSFSYQVQYEMDGEKLIPIEVSQSTMSIAGLDRDFTETIAGIALSKYSDASTDVLLVGYNNMAGEIIADILNNYAIVKGADNTSFSMTTRAK